MATYEVTSPNGEVFEVTAPNDATEAQVLAYAQQNFQKPQSQYVDMPDGTTLEFPPEMSREQIRNAILTKYKPNPAFEAQRIEAKEQEMLADLTKEREKRLQDVNRSWGDVALGAVHNAPASAINFGHGIYQALSHPLDTAKAVADLGAGALRAGVQKVSPGLVSRLDQLDDPQTTERIGNMASGAGQMLSDRYGSIPDLKRTLATDPVGAAADFSTLATGGAMLAPKLGTTGATLAKVAQITDPVRLTMAGIGKTAGLGSATARNAVGLATGAGADNIHQAFEAGRAGGNAGKTFRQNIRGDADMASVLESAREGIETIRENRSAAYSRNMAESFANQKPINFAPIEKAAADAEAGLFRGKYQLVSDAELRPVREAVEIVNLWKSDPTMHTAAGLDALKQRLDSVFPENPMHGQSQRALTGLRNAVKGEIVREVPSYAKAMDEFAESRKLQTEIERTMSLGRDAAADTSLRKLQSVGRNNVNTNFSNRGQLLKQLETEGGVSLAPALAGQALNSWTPRGLQGLTAAGQAAAGLAGFHPGALLGIAAQSPRLVGEIAHGMGRVRGGLDRLKAKLPRFSHLAFPNLNVERQGYYLNELERQKQEREKRRREQESVARRTSSGMIAPYQQPY